MHEPQRLHDVPVGVPAETVAGSRILSTLHRMDRQQGEGCIQVGSLDGSGQIMDGQRLVYQFVDVPKDIVEIDLMTIGRYLLDNG